MGMRIEALKRSTNTVYYFNMGKRDKKTGKGRLDKYYHLAKEQGYRARSAFKLIQLNKKYNFLERSRVLVDLCAAPGGWLQVASKYMPVSSLIIGVDIVPIKPLPKIITLQEDITTDKCRAALRNQLKTWKADVVLNDGAPNVGVAWVQDAYSQAELTLMALKLAVEFLSKGGIFVTKIFRSKDYNNLIWVFNQLFKKVEATKPASSRNVSAEIYVICKDFLAPKKIDPKFLDPRAVFQEVEIGPEKTSLDILHPEKKKRQREGYREGNYTLHQTASVMDLVNTNDPVRLLGDSNVLAFDTDEAKELLLNEITNDEIKISCQDLKVLGKREFKNLLKWRTAIRLLLNKDPPKEKDDKPEESVDEDEAIQNELDKLTKEEQARRKRLKRKSNEKKQKTITRMQLKMISPTDIALDQPGFDGGNSLFDLKKVDKAGVLKAVRKGDMNIVLDEEINEQAKLNEDIVIDDGKGAQTLTKVQKLSDKDEENTNAEDQSFQDTEDDVSALEVQLDQMYEEYRERKAERDAKYRVKRMRESFSEWSGIQDNSDKDDSDVSNYSMASRDNLGDETESSRSSDTDSDSEEDHPMNTNNFQDKKRKRKLITYLNGDDDGKIIQAGQLSKKASLFFDQPLFKGVLEEESDRDKNDELIKANFNSEMYEPKDLVESKSLEKQGSLLENNQSLKRKADEMEEEDDDDDEIEIIPTENNDQDETMWDGDGSDEDEKKMKRVQEIGLITPEAMNLAQQLVNRQKTKHALIDDGFTRQAFCDKEGLPEWFLEDEKRHNKPNLPITKEAVEAIRERMKALNARPIKKIAEAKARKKIRAVKRLVKLQKKTEAIAETGEMTEREKSQTITKMLSKNVKKKKDRKIVVAKGVNKGNKGRPKGVKGRYKMVDTRMKKEVRAMSRDSKKKGKGDSSRKRQKR
ncbi:hypothetical protein G9A89_007511 [Geosiphon pyriformis]|nr:hypothetical protein G9A89_007511 [Geosiphon pyriformis]